ncbi:Hypothetical protein I5071_83430 [Sandaracinus amylolyticus]|nr:Hypothetical protein I5071_83430 [Sandaracinus amylolyticus]
MMRRAWMAVAALLIVACGGAQHAGQNEGIDAIRRRAEERPNDPAAQAAWAEAELFMAGGDGEAAERAIARARQLDPESAEIEFLHAMERQLHGDLDESLDAHLRTIALARAGRTPLAASLAEVSVAFVLEFDDAVPDYARRVRDALTPIHAEPGAIGPSARHGIGSALSELAYRDGNLDAVRAISTAQGCSSSWRVAGPFGPRHLLGFDQQLAPEEPGPLAETYDLGPGRGTRPTRALDPRACSLHLGNGPVAGPGTTYAETEITVPAAGEYLVRLESPNSVELTVDDARVTRIDRRSEMISRITYHPVQLTAGTHRVMVKTATRHPNPLLVLSVLPASTFGDDFGDEAPAADRPLGVALRAARAIARADFVGARETLAPHLRDDQATGAMLVLGSIVALSDPLTGQQVAADEGRRLLTLAAERDPRAWYPRMQLANLEPDELTKIRMLRDAIQQWPEVLVLPLTLIDVLEARGWEAQTDAAITLARQVAPTACRPRRAALNAALRRGRSSEVGELSEALVACDARSDARLQHAVRQRRWEDAQREVARIASLEPQSSRYQTADAELTLARQRGDDAAVARLLTELAELRPRAEAVVMMQADRMLAAGDAQAAHQRIEAALREEPESMGDLRRILRAIGGASPIEAFRQDGARVIREYEASGHSYDGPKVLVLDYTVVRVFDDGSQLELTHQIVRVQSEEAVDDEGEFSPPEDAQLLTLRTIKADGRRLEPDEIQGKDTISMPNLAVGDYVEYEYLRASPAPGGFPNGALGDRFYFASFEVPFDRSELTVISPLAMELEVDPRGPAPETETTTEDGLRVRRWRVRESRPHTQEPGAVAAREYLPSILWAHNATWPAYVESLRDVLADREVRDPAHVRLVREIVGQDGNASPEQRARRIYQWVLTNVEDTNDPFGQAATMVHARTGNRSRVLLYLLHIAGIDADLALARSFAGDATQSDVADDETYAFLVVRMQGSSGPNWLWPGARGAPFGFLPLEPMIRGQQALVLDERGERTTVGDPGIESDLTNIELDVRLDGEGGAHVEVVETFRGAAAVAWRNQLEGVPAAHLEEIFERQYVARIAGGARMTELRITGREDAEQPLVLHYAFDVARLGRLTGDAHLVPQLYSLELASSYAPLARRATTQVMPGGARDVTMRVHLPEGAQAPVLPDERTMGGPSGMQATWRASAQGNVVTVERRVRLPRARVTPEQYPELARFARAYDEAEAIELRVGM